MGVVRPFCAIYWNVCKFSPTKGIEMAHFFLCKKNNTHALYPPCSRALYKYIFTGFSRLYIFENADESTKRLCKVPDNVLFECFIRFWNFSNAFDGINDAVSPVFEISRYSLNNFDQKREFLIQTHYTFSRVSGNSYVKQLFCIRISLLTERV